MALHLGARGPVAPATSQFRGVGTAPRVAAPALLRRKLCVRASASSNNSSSQRESTRTRAVEAAMSSPAAAFMNQVAEAVDWASMSYSKQYDRLFQQPLNTKQPIPKPSKDLQIAEGGSKVLLSDVAAIPKRPLLFGREWTPKDIQYVAFIGGMHLLALAAPFTFSWPMFWLFMGSYFVTGCLGITLAYHRMLSHRSFTTPKWLEHILAYCGVLAVQGDPIEWSSTHRYHHLHTDTPLDPHSPYEGFWWCHMGWLLDDKATEVRVGNKSNALDLSKDPFYVWLGKTFPLHVAAQFALLFVLGGFPAVVWGGALRMCWVWHITWFVNSATHCWGTQTYNTGDLSRNNWWVGILAFGEGWHNNHHAFEFSARHGFEWWQVDGTWYMILLLEKLGLATNVKYPTEKQKAKLAFDKPKDV